MLLAWLGAASLALYACGGSTEEANSPSAPAKKVQWGDSAASASEEPAAAEPAEAEPPKKAPQKVAPQKAAPQKAAAKAAPVEEVDEIDEPAPAKAAPV